MGLVEKIIMENIDILSESDLERINLNYVLGVDKWHQMYCGIASHLDRYEKGIIYLNVKNTEKKYLSNYGIALMLIKLWVNNTKEISQAKGFVVSFYRTISTGFVMTVEDMENNKELIDKLNQDFISAVKQQNNELINVFSGLLG